MKHVVHTNEFINQSLRSDVL